MLEPITINELLLLGNVTFVRVSTEHKDVLEMMRLNNGYIEWWDNGDEGWGLYGSRSNNTKQLLESNTHRLYLYLPEDE